MNRLRNLFAAWCPALLLAAGLARAETVYWSDNFDTNGASHWSASATGVWKIGAPSAGPAVGASGYRTHSGADCASSQGAGLSKDARLECVNYNGATSLTVPSADQYPRLRFWHWFNFDNALGYVEVSADGGATWTQLSPTYLNLNGGGVWTRPDLDLSAYAGRNLRIAFHFTSGCCTGNGLGWFVDDVAVVTGTPAVNFPESFEAGQGDWSVDFGTWQVGQPASGPAAAHTGVNCAATVLAGNYANNVDSRLISPPILVPAAGGPALSFYHWYNFNNALGFVEINNGSLTTTSVTNTTVTTNASTVLDTNVYQFVGSFDVAYSAPFHWNSAAGQWTNSMNKALAYVYTPGIGYFFESGYATTAVGGANVDYRGAILPDPLTAPTNFLDWQGMTWVPVANEADSPVGYFGTNYIYSYTTNTTVVSSQSSWTQLSPTYKNATSGGLWTNTSVDLSAYAGQVVHVAFHFTSGGLSTAPGWYVDDINLIGAPQLAVPGTQTIYAGQSLTVTNYATNSILPNAIYSFAVLSPTLQPVITGNGPGSAVFTWTNLGVANGVLTWTNGPAVPGTYTIAVKATDNSVPPLSVTNSFQLVILPPLAPNLTVPANQGIFAGQLLTVTNYASNPNLPWASYTFSLLSPTNAAIRLTTGGVLTWTPPTTQPSGSTTITVKVADNSRPPLAATNSFVVAVTNLWAPILTVPPNQAIFAGMTLTVTNYATNYTFATDTFTFEMLGGLTNTGATLDATRLADQGILSWATTMALKPGTYTNLIKVTDDATQYTATNSFLVVVSKTPPPRLSVPSTQTIYAGQLLTVTNVVADIAYPDGPFTFALLAGLTNANANLDDSDLATDGVLTWTTTTILKAGKYTNIVTVANDTTGLSATNRFLIVVSNPPPPVLTVPSLQTIYAGRQLAVTVSATNAAFPNAVYAFATRIAPAGVSLTAQDANDSLLTWTPTAAQATNIYNLSITVADDNTPPLMATNGFQVVVAPTPPPPILVFPSVTPTNYAGQTLAVPLSATNTALPAALYAYRLPAPSTNYWLTADGVLTWTNTGIRNGILVWTNDSVAPGTNLISVIVSDDSVPSLSATNSFSLVLAPPLPPTLTVPGAQTVYAGQTLVATNYATNTFLPLAQYAFGLVSPTNAGINLTTGGVLTWTPTAAQPLGQTTVTVEGTDNSVPALFATNSFTIVVTPPPPVLSTVAYSHNLGFKFGFQTASNTTWRILASTSPNAGGHWLPIFTNLAGPNGTLMFTDLLATNFPHRYYRAVLP